MAVIVQYQKMAEPVFVPAAAVVPPMGWFVEHPEAPQKTRIPHAGYFVEPVFVPVLPMGWFVQPPEVPPKSKVPDPGYLGEPVFTPTPEVVTMDKWWKQPAEYTRYRQPKAEEFVVEPLAPNNFILQKLDWLVEHPVAPSRLPPAQSGWFVEPIVVPAPPPVTWGWFTQSTDQFVYRRPLPDIQSFSISPIGPFFFDHCVHPNDIFLLGSLAEDLDMLGSLATSVSMC